MTIREALRDATQAVPAAKAVSQTVFINHTIGVKPTVR
jgi:hypothetical protein